MPIPPTRVADMGKGKHRRPRGAGHELVDPRRLFRWVDVRTNTTHLLTPDAAAAGRLRAGRYVALCGADVLPASLTEPGRCGVCQPCTAAVVLIPAQRSRTPR
ncbi:MAG: hypothetical protein ACRDTA_13975 [Pseudonocardiaceae bacterium]